MEMQDERDKKPVVFNGLLWSRDFDRFFQLLMKSDGNPVLICQPYPGIPPRFITKKGKARTRYYWYHRFTDAGWVFLDPTTQIACASINNEYAAMNM